MSAYQEELSVGQPGFFDIKHCVEELLYVGWFDIMGTQSSMRISLSKISNFIFKMYSYAYEANKNNLEIYPLMDGFFVTHKEKNVFLNFVDNFFSNLFLNFVSEKRNEHKFMIRGGVAYGPVFVGRAMSANYHFKDSLLIGSPVVQAYAGEKHASPFGVYLDESVRTFPSVMESIPSVYYQWADNDLPQEIADNKYEKIEEYLKWCREKSKLILYPEDRIDEHLKLAKQYFDKQIQVKSRQRQREQGRGA